MCVSVPAAAGDGGLLGHLCSVSLYCSVELFIGLYCECVCV